MRKESLPPSWFRVTPLQSDDDTEVLREGGFLLLGCCDRVLALRSALCCRDQIFHEFLFVGRETDELQAEARRGGTSHPHHHRALGRAFGEFLLRRKEGRPSLHL